MADMSMFDASMINQTMMTQAAANVGNNITRQFASDADKQLRNDFLTEMDSAKPSPNLLSEEEKQNLD